MAKSKKKLLGVNAILVIVLVLVIAAGAYYTLHKQTPVEEKETVPGVKATILGTDCGECFDVSAAIELLKQQEDFNITDAEELTVEQSNELAEKYGIKKLPAIIFTGNIDNITITGFENVNDALVFSDAPAPYYSVADKKVKGKITAIELDSGCLRCFNVSQAADQLKQMGLAFTERKKVSSASDEGKKLIEKYKIEKLPALILSNDALEYDLIKQAWSQVGTEEKDGNLVLREVAPPYINVSNGNVQGLVEITYVVDEKCTDCYNVTIFKDVFEKGFGMVFKSEKEIDVSSGPGRVLVKNNKIELVPTIVLSSEALMYPMLGQNWGQIGTIEDGVLVFREVPSLPNLLQADITYENLTSGEKFSAEYAAMNIPVQASTDAPDITVPEKTD